MSFLFPKITIEEIVALAKRHLDCPLHDDDADKARPYYEQAVVFLEAGDHREAGLAALRCIFFARGERGAITEPDYVQAHQSLYGPDANYAVQFTPFQIPLHPDNPIR